MVLDELTELNDALANFTKALERASAANDLLEALEKITNARPDGGSIAECRQIARAAIAKAKGVEDER